MKRTLQLAGLACLLVLMSCEQKADPSQSQFLLRLKKTQDTVDIFQNKEVLKARVITNLNKYVRDNALTFKNWTFHVENIAADKLNLKSVGLGDSLIYGVPFAMLIPQNNAAVKDAITKLKVGDKIAISGEMAMKTEDGKVSMNSYFESDSTKFIKLMPTEVK
ncbi:hypothetical protein B0I27_10736 [Arcticibacter pallidicorallinus]|uniref:Lipoprotein n=1 Tax=Arcticibacter pallidicorallinus TaxID=1259464 RepID=A0A2T0U0L8_9SPHI|nr:hypothetical protein [Arcticibacter pallidicorallinus]PRY51451.1 hypothetical protein B0I27_10736 [Arcticibacter pallidicorallinus]